MEKLSSTYEEMVMSCGKKSIRIFINKTKKNINKIYFPIQNSENISPSNSSEDIGLVIKPNSL